MCCKDLQCCLICCKVALSLCGQDIWYSTCHAAGDWHHVKGCMSQVPITKICSMKRKGPESTLRIPGEYYLCGFYWYLIMQFNTSGTSLGCYLHWTAKLNSATEMSPPEAFVLASISLSLKNETWGPDFGQVASMKKEHNFGGGLGMGWGNPFKVALKPDEHEGELARHLDLAGFVTEGFLDVQFTVDVRLDQ